MENVLKVTLLKLEDEKEPATDNGSQEKNKQDQSTDKADDKKEEEEKKKDDTDKNIEDGEEEKKDELEGKEKVGEETEKATNNKNKDGSLDVAISKKPDRSMDNTCKSRSFVPTAEVNLYFKNSLKIH